ncbi:MAG: hypothetical protein AAGK00_18160 [Pseudomonadota bacterium]
MCAYFSVFYLAVPLLAALLPAIDYRRHLRAQGDVTGMLPLLHPRILLGGILWCQFYLPVAKLKDQLPERLFHNNRMVNTRWLEKIDYNGFSYSRFRPPSLPMLKFLAALIFGIGTVMAADFLLCPVATEQ